MFSKEKAIVIGIAIKRSDSNHLLAPVSGPILENKLLVQLHLLPGTLHK